MRNIISLVLVLLFGAALLWGGTSGFKAFTAEGLRRMEVQAQPRVLPDVPLQDANGQIFSLKDYTNKIVVITFLYTNCIDECPVIESNFGKTYEDIPAQNLGKDVVFLSISFDHDRDTPDVLKSYSQHLLQESHADDKTWRFARVENKADQAALLKAFDIVVIPDGKGGFEHNDAVYLINRQGQLSEIMDTNTPKAAADKVKSMMRG